MGTLHNKRILILRSVEDIEETVEKVQRVGGIPIACPMIVLEKPPDTRLLEETIRTLHQFDWIFFTSAAGVQFFCRQVWELGFDPAYVSKVKISVIGPATQRALKEQNLLPDFVSPHATAERFFSEFQTQYKVENLKILLPQSSIAQRTLPDLFKQYGAAITEVIAYCNVPVLRIDKEIIQSLILGEIDYVLFTSSSTVRNFIMALKAFPLAISRINAASIGPSTSAALRDMDIEPIVEAVDHSINGMLDALIRFA